MTTVEVAEYVFTKTPEVVLPDTYILYCPSFPEKTDVCDIEENPTVYADKWIIFEAFLVRNGQELGLSPKQCNYSDYPYKSPRLKLWLGKRNYFKTDFLRQINREKMKFQKVEIRVEGWLKYSEYNSGKKDLIIVADDIRLTKKVWVSP